MPQYLKISCNLNNDDYEEIVRYRISAIGLEFSASTEVWGLEADYKNLLKSLAGFPKSIASTVEFSFGRPGTGACTLRFVTTNSRGHCCVWAHIEAWWPPDGQEELEKATVCVPFVPADIDHFCTELKRFKRGRTNEAFLGSHSRQ